MVGRPQLGPPRSSMSLMPAPKVAVSCRSRAALSMAESRIRLRGAAESPCRDVRRRERLSRLSKGAAARRLLEPHDRLVSRRSGAGAHADRVGRLIVYAHLCLDLISWPSIECGLPAGRPPARPTPVRP